MDYWDNEIVLPMYTYTIENIFTDRIPFFNVNFINPPSPDEPGGALHWQRTQPSLKVIFSNVDEANVDDRLKAECGMTAEEFKDGIEGEFDGQDSGPGGAMHYRYKRTINRVKYELTFVNSSSDPAATVHGKFYSLYENTEEVLEEGTINAFSYELQNVIKSWYRILRMIALVGMMSVLVYIGIRILISSTSSQKAKHKELLKDWLVGMLLLFTMHYIMNFANVFVDQITYAIAGDKSNFSDNHKVVSPQYINKVQYNDKVKEAIEEKDFHFEDLPEDVSPDYISAFNNKIIYGQKKQADDEKYDYFLWPTDSMGMVRMQASLSKREGSSKYIGYTVMFLVLMIYIAVFSWTYLKRVVYMAFLTLIAPLVALTYPIDKVNDGSAQGFNYWFREYIFNLLIRPLHLLLYVILITSALELASSNMVYSLVALGFMATAEKIVRQMFNFSKARTPGVFAGAAGAALTFTGIRKLLSHGPKGGGPDKNGGNGGQESPDSKTPSKINRDGIADRFRGALGAGSSTDASGTGRDEQSGKDEEEKNNEPEEGNLPREEKPPIGGPETAQEGGAEETAENLPTRDIPELEGDDSAELDDGKNHPWKDYWASTKRSIGGARGYYTQGLKNKFKRTLKNSHPVRQIAKTLAGGAVAATAGTIGLAAGIASGDPSKVAQYAGITGLAGYKLGTRSYDSVRKSLHVEGADEAMKMGFYGDDYKKKKAEKFAKEYASREDIVRQVYNNNPGMSWKQAREATKRMTNEYGIKEGIYDPKEWKKLEKVRKKGVLDGSGDKIRDYTESEAVGARMAYNRYFQGYKDTTNDKIRQRIRESNPGIDNKLVEKILTSIRQYDDIENS